MLVDGRIQWQFSYYWVANLWMWRDHLNQWVHFEVDRRLKHDLCTESWLAGVIIMSASHDDWTWSRLLRISDAHPAEMTTGWGRFLWVTPTEPGLSHDSRLPGEP